jgi:hypothetical protein
MKEAVLFLLEYVTRQPDAVYARRAMQMIEVVQAEQAISRPPKASAISLVAPQTK